MSSSPRVTSSMLADAKECLRQHDFARARALAKTILAYNPDDSEAIQILLTAEQGHHSTSFAGDEVVSSDSIGDVKAVIIALAFFVLGIFMVYRGIQVGWNGSTGGGYRGKPSAMTGSASIIVGLGLSAVSGTILVIGFRRFRLY